MAKSPKGLSFSECIEYENIRRIEYDFVQKIISNRGMLQTADTSLSVATLTQDFARIISESGNRGIEYEFDIDVVSDKIDYKLKLMTQITGGKTTNQATYSMILMSSEGIPKTRIHFDYDYSTSGRDGKPSPHIQSGGRLKPPLQETSCCWDPKVDKPRVLSLPYCTPILWDNAFREFPNAPGIQPFIKNKEWWKGIVIEAEKKLWAPFFQEGHNHTNARGSSFINHLYGLSHS